MGQKSSGRGRRDGAGSERDSYTTSTFISPPPRRGSDHPILGRARRSGAARPAVYGSRDTARLERRRVHIGLTVFTDHNPSSTYGKETIAGVTARLLWR